MFKVKADFKVKEKKESEKHPQWRYVPNESLGLNKRKKD